MILYEKDIRSHLLQSWSLPASVKVEGEEDAGSRISQRRPTPLHGLTQIQPHASQLVTLVTSVEHVEETGMNRRLDRIVTLFVMQPSEQGSRFVKSPRESPVHRYSP